MTHYNAFISYNHNPRDIRIASMLQSQLENFKIPAGVKSSAGISKIERVFLDKGELEVAGDLNKVICDALENTDWLIVICSPESRKSIWVQREIEYFLRNHTLDNILTVITDGEPFDVLPEILLDGDREPLSCDYRQPGRTARNIELPRLAAAMIGCRYDDLVQRQRHYRMRRLTIAASAAAVLMLCAITYLIWSNNQIRTSLNTSLREQSLNLSNQSEQALSSGDRISALRYALDALPSEGKTRPVVPEAVFALSRAMNLYKSVDSLEKYAVRRYPSNGHRHVRLETASWKDRTFMSELYNNGRFVLWDADTGKELMADYSSGLMEDGTRVQNLCFISSGNLILVTENSIRVIDPFTEKELSNFSIGGEYFKLYDFSMFRTRCDDLLVRDGVLWIPVATVADNEEYSDLKIRHNSLAVVDLISRFAGDSYDGDQMVLYIRKNEVSDISFRIVGINIKSGKVIAEAPAPRRPVKMCVSPDGKHIACCYTDIYDLGDESGDDSVIVMKTDDLSVTGSIKCAFAADCTFDSMNHLIIGGFDEKPEKGDSSNYGSLDYTSNGSRVIYTFTKDRNLILTCYDTATNEELWRKEKSINTGGFPKTFYTEGDVMFSNAVFCNVGNTLLITGSDGKELAYLHTLSNIVDQSCGKAFMASVLDDGRIMSWTYDDDGKLFSITGSKMLLGPVVDCTEAGGYTFTLSTDSESNTFREILTQYVEKGIDSKWEAYEYGGSSDPEEESELIDADHYKDSFVEIRRGRSGYEIVVRDVSSGKILRDINTAAPSPREDSTDGSQVTQFRYSGQDREKGKVYFLDNNNFLELRLLSVDLETGKETEIPLTMVSETETKAERKLPSLYEILQPIDLYSDYAGMAGIFSLDSKNIYYAAMEAVENESQDSFQYHVVVLKVDPGTGETSVSSIKDPADDFDNALYANTRLNAACGRLIVYENSGMTSYDLSGKKIWTGEDLTYEPVGFTCADDGTVVALEKDGSEAILHIYSSRDGSETAVESLGSVNLLSHEKMDCMDMSDQEKMITAGDDAYLADSRTWDLRTVISDNYIAFSPETGQFMLGDVEAKETGHAPYRTLEDMIAEAGEMLED